VLPLIMRGILKGRQLVENLSPFSYAFNKTIARPKDPREFQLSKKRRSLELPPELISTRLSRLPPPPLPTHHPLVRQ